MKMKKMLSLLTAASLSASCFAGMAMTARAATIDDLVTISSNATFIAQNEVSAALSKDTLSWNSKLLTLNGENSYNTSKGYSVYNGEQVQNLLQLKQGRNMAVKVSGPCTIDVYHDDNSSRVVQAGSTNKGTDYEVSQAVYLNETTTKNYDIDTVTVPNAGVVYLGASGDVYVAAIDIKMSASGATTAPTTAPEATPTTAPTVDISLDVDSATKYLGQTQVVNAKVTNGGAADDIIWTTTGEGFSVSPASGDNAKATVSFLNIGEGTVTATIGDVSTTCKIEVKTPSYVEASSDDISELIAVSETTVYDILDFAEAAKGDNAKAESGSWVYPTNKLYFDNEIAVVGANAAFYQQGKKTMNLDDTENSNGVRVKGTQDVFAVKLAAGSTVEANITGGGGSVRYATISTTIGADGDLVKSLSLENYATEKVSYTADEEKIVYISATGDSFLSQIMVVVPAAAVVDPEITYDQKQIFTENDGDDVAAFKANIKAGTYAVKSVTWTAEAGTAKVSNSMDVEIASGTEVVCGLIVKASTVNVNDITATAVASVE